MSARTLFSLSLAVALLSAVLQPALAQPKPATLSAAGSEIAFTTKQMGVPVEGKFPQASFQSSAIKAAGPGRFEVTGKLSIKGQVRDITVPVQLSQAGASSTASGAFTIKRLEFKVGEGEWADTSMLANDVQVRFKLVLTGVPAL